ncbi:MotA/TolQ/ExbB proton channel family protein [Aquicoccus sp. G2-2]|uniref:MotA/TolQ/ExbB proton channel family protein n=1 Tax=Aquicoccus sp. G2-2 TaxID=3092120 RepID=UPI002ADFBD4A|nr:MotA/TolQ/ExbB proton channel family protein [Aquicoccus sp. G2-2]MEA1114498.1 MotA/TolQ/ExbB proton channel family protein [Aquicoccus sp. G2-2]
MGDCGAVGADRGGDLVETVALHRDRRLGKGRAKGAVALWEDGQFDAARARVADARTLRAGVLRTAFAARGNLPEKRAREETARVARNALGDATGGLRALELIATIAPLLGLLGTVLGMIAAFQTLQQSGNRADPAMLAGGIWEALLTTAAGMAVAIPASAALTWFEAVIERMRRDVEDAATRIFVADPPGKARHHEQLHRSAPSAPKAQFDADD